MWSLEDKPSVLCVFPVTPDFADSRYRAEKKLRNSSQRELKTPLPTIGNGRPGQ